LRAKKVVLVSTQFQYLVKWKNETFFPDKFNDFHGCTLNFGKVMLKANEKRRKKHEKFRDADYEINEAMAKKLNFKTKYLLCKSINTTNDICKLKNNKSVKIETAMEARFAQRLFFENDTKIQLAPFVFNGYSGFFIPPGN
jgi:hypothetical protein